MHIEIYFQLQQHLDKLPLLLSVVTIVAPRLQVILVVLVSQSIINQYVRVQEL